MRNLVARLRIDLVERRLWPIAALLAVALVSVPLLLRSDPAPAGPPPAPAAAEDDGGLSLATAQRAVANALGADVRKPPRPGRPRDPFPSAAASGATRDRAARADIDAEPRTSSTPSNDGGRSASSAAPRSASPAPSSGTSTPPAAPKATPAPASPPRVITPPADPKPSTYRLLRTDVRFDGQPVHDVVRLRPFPGARAPLALYLGPTPSGKAAFVLSGGASVSGEGRCRPRRRLCTHLILAPGEKATLTAPKGGEHTLELVRIQVDKTTSRTAAERFYNRQSEKGRCVLDVLDYLGFDADTGTVAPHHDNRECEYVFSRDGARVGAR